MDNRFLFVSIIIPCRNEEKFIRACLDSVVSNDYPKDRLEVLIIDGMSEDKTKFIIKEYAEKYSFIKIFQNNKKIAPVAQNIGLEKSGGEIVLIMDAHAIYPKDYISKCVFSLEKHGVDCVGGLLRVFPRNNSFIGRAIALAFSSSFGAGNAEYKTYSSKNPKLVDTVPYGCFRREIFDKIGNWNEKFDRSYDVDFYSRLRRSGGKILLLPDIFISYYVRSDIEGFWKHNFLDGVWVTYPLKFANNIPFSWRHFVPLFFVLSLTVSAVLSFLNCLFLMIFLFIIILYLLANIYYSFSISIKEKNLTYLPVLFLVFLIRHFAYGLGSIRGLLKLIK